MEGRKSSLLNILKKLEIMSTKDFQQIRIEALEERLKQELINQITPKIQTYHNEKNISDLHTLDIDELTEILTDLNEN
jgi:uncharacterized protein YktB (UPF0637 family)